MVEIILGGDETIGTAFWVTYFTVMGTLGGVGVAIYKQIVTQKDNKKFTFIKHIEDYEKELSRIWEKYHRSKFELIDCKLCADQTLVIIDKIAYLRKRKMLDQETIQYFRYWFAVGQSYYNWKSKVDNKNYELNFPYFLEINKSIQNKAPDYVLEEHFYKHIK